MVEDLERERRQERRSREAKRTWLDLAPATALVLLVLAILVAGAWLHVEEREESDREPTAATRPTPRGPSPPRPAARAEPPPPESPPPERAERPLPGGSLEQRAARDRGRLERAGDVWTLQLAASCESETVSRLTGSVDPGEPLYVVPWTDGGSGCYRLCWGSWPDRASAAAASPPPPLQLGDPPFARRAAEIVR